ncbi:MAG: hypothetical protein HY698_17395 [Deltaproteobacteria bacterium]|nr:hypothetical protein [Deltaproteobacteria bacterium]
MRGRRLELWGALALLLYALHAANHIRRGEVHDLLWVCNVAPLILGIGCLARSAIGVAIPLLWLSFGTPLWLLDVLTGGELIVTAIFTHVGGLAISALAVRTLGMPSGAWYKAAGALGILVGLSRVLTPRQYNVNVSFSVWAGWQAYFPSHVAYLGLLLAISTSVFFVVERLLVRFTSVSEAR